MDFRENYFLRLRHPTIVRSQLVSQLAEMHSVLSPKDVDYAIRCLLNFLADGLSKGHRIEIRGFGSFSLSHRKKRITPHPKTGATIFLPAKSIPRFKPGKAFREEVNKSAGDSPRRFSVGDGPRRFSAGDGPRRFF